MGCYYILAANANGDIPGGRSFVWQCVTYLLKTDLLIFTAIACRIIAFGIVVKAFIEILED